MTAASVYSEPLEYHGCDPLVVRLARRVIGLADRPCEPGQLLRCVACRLFWAPCTQTAIDMEAVLAGIWSCHECQEAGR